MGRKKIAVLVAQTEDKMQHAFLSGFLKQAYTQNYDVCVFSMLLKFQETQPRGVGDSNIYNLINYSSFDAIVILKDTIQTANIRKDIYHVNWKNDYFGSNLRHRRIQGGEPCQPFKETARGCTRDYD